MQSVNALRRLVALGPDRRVSVELALTLPPLITLLGGGLEITNYVLIYQKVERTSATISDLVAQSARMTESEMKSLFSATEYVMKPFDLATDGNSSSRRSAPAAAIRRSSAGSDRPAAATTAAASARRAPPPSCLRD